MLDISGAAPRSNVGFFFPEPCSIQQSRVDRRCDVSAFSNFSVPAVVLHVFPGQWFPRQQDMLHTEWSEL